MLDTSTHHAPRIYVACLASYNNGVMHGEWIDATADAEEMQEHVDRILRASPYPNVMVDCPRCDGDGTVDAIDADDMDPPTCRRCNGKGQVPSAEEFAIHDFDGIPSSLGEYCGLDAVAEYVAFLDDYSDHDAADLAAIVADYGDTDTADTAMRDNYCGTFAAFKEYADEAADEMIACHTADGNAPQMLINYFDYDAFARDLEMDMHTIDTPSGVAVFYA